MLLFPETRSTQNQGMDGLDEARPETQNPEHCSGFAVRTGLEPATSAVTGRHSNQLNYRSLIVGGAKIGVFLIATKQNLLLSS